jgi:hypothetical protein
MASFSFETGTGKQYPRSRLTLDARILTWVGSKSDPPCVLRANKKMEYGNQNEMARSSCACGVRAFLFLAATAYATACTLNYSTKENSTPP